MANDFSTTVVIDRPDRRGVRLSGGWHERPEVQPACARDRQGDGGTAWGRHHGFGKVIMPLAVRGARKDADAFGKRIKAAVEAS
jgi:hypothetical protein